MKFVKFYHLLQAGDLDDSQPMAMTGREQSPTKVPKNGIRESSEQTRGSRKSASRDRMSKDISMI